MSRKHFKALADAISQIPDMANRKLVANIVGSVCKQCNSRFDFHKFFLACGIED